MTDDEPTGPSGPSEGPTGRRPGETESGRQERLREEVPWIYEDYRPRG